MQITVRLFAALHDVAGVRELTLEVPEGAAVRDLARELWQRYPGLRAHAPTTAYAVNAEYVPDGHPLHDGDEVALIPPVSGGAHV
jgi:molybdopterin converting factor subunit 1